MKRIQLIAYILVMMLYVPSLVATQPINNPVAQTQPKKSFWTAKKVALAVGAALTTVAATVAGVVYRYSGKEKEKELIPLQEFKNTKELTKQESDFISYFDALPHELQVKVFEELVKSTPAYDLKKQVIVYSQVSKKFNEVAHSSPAWRAIQAKEYTLDDIEHELQLKSKRIDLKKDINMKSPNQETALHIASKSGNLKIVEALLKHGAQVDSQNQDYETPFMKAVFGSYYKIADLLLHWGANVNHQDFHRLTALHRAVMWGNIDMIKYLLSKGARVDIKDTHGTTPYDLIGRWPYHQHTSTEKIQEMQKLFLKKTIENVIQESLPIPAQ